MSTKGKRNAWLIAGVILLIPLLLWARSSAPPTGRTGAPGESTCTGCHSNTTATGNVTITFPNGNTYTPGTRQRITIKVTDSTARRWGYEVTAVQASATSTGAGTFSTPDSFSGIQTANTKSYGGHTSSGTFAGTATSATWQLDWTPPATSVGDIVFYIAGMGANNDGGSGGDHTFTANYTLTAAAAAPSLAAAPTSLSFSYTQNGTTPAAQSVALSSSGTALNYTATASAAWLSVSSGTGTTPGNISVSVNPSGLAPGTYNGSVSVAATGAANTPLAIPVSLTVNAPPNLAASPTSLTFAGQAGGAAPAAQTIAVSSSGSALSYTVTDSATWLSVTPTSGSTPGSLSVTANQSGLAAGTYTANVTITSGAAGNSPLNVPVTFNVTPPPSLAVTPTSLTFSAQTSGSAPPAQSFSVSSSGSALSYTTSTSAAWLTATPASGSTPGTVSVSVNQSGLAAGTYTGNVTLTSSGAANSPLNVPVTLNVTSSAVLGANPASVSFSYQIGGTAPAAQTVALTASSGTLNFTTAKSSATWLSVTPASGTTPGSMSISANPTGLAAGTYNGSVTVTATGASNSPLTVPVSLTVTPAPTITLTPSTLTFTAQAGGTATAAQSVAVASSGSALSYTTTASAAWLTATPASGTTPGTINVSANPSALAAGTYTGTVTVTSSGAGNSPQTVGVTFTVTPPPLPNMTVSPSTLTFNYQTGGTAPATQNVAVSSSGAAFNYTTSTSASWLTATASGTTPGTVAVGINPSGLTAGTYNGTVTIASTGAANSPRTVAVTLNVTSPPSLTLSPSSLNFAYTQGGTTPAAQSISVGSSGATLNYTASASAAWLSVSPASGSTSGSISVSVNPSSLAAGTYNGNVTITASGAANSPQTIPVTLTVASSNSLLVTATPQNLSFAYAIGDVAPSSQRISIGSSGASADFRATVNQPWLMITSASGPTPGYLDIAVSADGMAAGTYSGAVTLMSSTAANTPMSIPVTLVVSNATLSVSQGNLSFNYRIGGTAPASQTVAINSTSPVTYSATSSAAWLTASPGTGSTPGNLTIGVNATGLAAGNYTGSVTIAASGASNSPQTISVSLAVTSSTASSVTAAPNGLTFFYRPGDTAPAAQSVALSSSTATSFTAAAAGGSWLSASPSSGTTNASVSVSVNTTGMPSGTYTGLLNITPNGGTAFAVPVTLIISSGQTSTSGMKLDAVPYTFDTAGTAGVSAAWAYGAGYASQPGDISQALVLVKNGASSTNAQAGAQIPGAAGIALNELGFDIRNGQCTTSGPHFAVVTSDNVAHVLACGSGVAQASPATGWIRVRFDLTKALPAITPGQTINSLSLVLSAGPDSNSGFAVIDNIDVNGSLISKP